MVAGSGSSGSATSTFGTRPERLRRRPGERLGCRSRNHEGVLSTWIDDDAGTIHSRRTARTLCPMNGTDEAPSAAPHRSDSSVVKATRKTLPSSSCHVSNAPSVSSARTRNSASGSNSFRPRRRSPVWLRVYARPGSGSTRLQEIAISLDCGNGYLGQSHEAWKARAGLEAMIDNAVARKNGCGRRESRDIPLRWSRR